MNEVYSSSGKKYNGEKAIISLTSWKARINTVSKTLFSLIQQCPGFHIVLCLSEEEFPKKEAELPENLMIFVDNDLIEILWVYKNYKSFKKVLFTMDKYRDVPIISADDDCIYTCNYAQELYDKWVENKDCIITNDGGHEKELNWCRGPNTLYFYNAELLKIPDLYFKQNFNFIEDDMTLGIFFKLKSIKIIDLKKKSFYFFHTNISAISSSYKWNYKSQYNKLLKFIKSII